MRVGVLGWLRAQGADGGEVELGGPLERRVLAVLVLRAGDVVSLDTLADAVFGEQSTTGATIRLKNHVSRLRKRLCAGAVVTVAPGYRLDVDVVELDWCRFEELIGAATGVLLSDPVRAGELFEEALSLWRGAPFCDLEDWSASRALAGRLEELHRVAQEEHAGALVAAGRSSEAVALLEGLVAEEPLRERRWAALMLALYRGGRQADAQRAFQRARGELAEVGLEPGLELQTLDRAISVQDPILALEPLTELQARSRPRKAEEPPSAATPAAGERRSNLPCTADAFVGREQDLAWLATALGAHHLVTIVGVGGMGKTRLALEAARRATGFGEGIWFVELGSVPAGGDVVPTVMNTLGLRAAAGVDATHAIAEWCSRLDALLIIDNSEHVLPGVARLVAAILARAPVARLLATSREPLAIAGEHVLPLRPLALETNGGRPAEAVQLLVERTTAMRPDFDPTPVQPALAAICAQLDGMPLAIELAAARLRTLTPTAVADRLHQRFRLLTGGTRTASERHKTLRATVDWSYDLLDEAQRRLFDCLAVFTGAFSLDDVAAVGADQRSDGHEADLDPVVDDDDVVGLLAELVDRSLVTVTNAEPSYRLLETLRAYGLERLNARGELDSVRRRHALWFAAKATRTRADACGPAEHAVWQLAMAQLSEYHSAAAWALGHDEIDLAVGIPTDLTEAFWLRYAIDVTAWAAPLIGQITTADPVTQARVLWNVGCYQQVMLGDLAASGPTLEAAARLDPTNAYCGLQGSIQGVLTGDLNAMRDQAARALALAGDDPAATAAAYTLLSSCAFLTGHPEDARRHATEFLARAKAWAWPGAIGHALFALARVDASTSPQQARQRLHESHRIAQQIESYSLINITQMELISLMIDDGHDATAAMATLDLLRRTRRELEMVFLTTALALAVILLERAGDHSSAADIARALTDSMITNIDRARYDRSLAALQTQLNEHPDDPATGSAPASAVDLADLAITALTRLVGQSRS